MVVNLIFVHPKAHQATEEWVRIPSALHFPGKEGNFSRKSVCHSNIKPTPVLLPIPVQSQAWFNWEIVDHRESFSSTTF